jgi:salicylate hydroxylase
MNQAEFLIVGGGIAGLAAAIAVASQGHPVSVCEKAAAFDPIGAGLQLGPNAVRALQVLGAWDEVEPITYAPPAIHVRDGVSGKLLKELTLGAKFEARFGQPYRVAHRADLHAALLSVARRLSLIEIRMGKSIDVWDLRHTGPTIIADGIWSAAREHLFSGTKAITLPEKIHRSLLPCPDVIGIEMDSVNLWLHPGGHVVHYPVGTSKLLNLVAVTQGAEPSVHFVKADPILRHVLQFAAPWTTWPAAYVPPLKHWNSGPCLLIGDAAHGTVPYLAQGAAMALEDAAALQNNPTDLGKISTLRAARTRRLHNASLQQAKIYHASGFAKIASHNALALLPESVAWSRLSWLYKG